MAAYFDTDVSLVRAIWVLLAIIPGALIGGLLAYAAAWAVMPVSVGPPPVVSGRRVVRPQAERKIAGVCAGLAKYFAVDVTLVRLLWVILSIYPGAIVCGVLAYAIAWFIIPSEAVGPMHPAPLPL